MTTAANASTPPRPERPLGPRLFRWLLTAGIILPLIWAGFGLEITPRRLAEAPRQIWNILEQMFFWPAWDNTGRSVDKIMESLYIAWVGTIIGATFSFPLAFLAATNMAPRWVAVPVRGLLSAIRAFPEVVLAIILIPAFGLGPFTGTLAIGLHSIGTLGKLSSEVIEGIDAGPLEAIDAAGGTRTSAIRFGVLPQAMPTILAYWLYRFEINIRASAVLGIIGAGGIGAELFARLKFRDFPEAGNVLLLTIIAVLVIDSISGAVRRRIISGEPGGGRLTTALAALGAKRATETA